MRTSDADPMTDDEFEALIDDALDGSLISDTGAGTELEAALVRIATAETSAERARAVDAAREIFAAERATT